MGKLRWSTKHLPVFQYRAHSDDLNWCKAKCVDIAKYKLSIFSLSLTRRFRTWGFCFDSKTQKNSRLGQLWTPLWCSDLHEQIKASSPEETMGIHQSTIDRSMACDGPTDWEKPGLFKGSAGSNFGDFDGCNGTPPLKKTTVWGFIIRSSHYKTSTDGW